MKNKILNYIKVAAFLIFVAICVLGASILVKRKDSDYKYAPFFEQAREGNIDILFMGSSHVINGINPVQLYRDYGYTSYNMGGHGSVMQATYWELIEALDYCTPKWVVVDAYMLEKNYQYLDVMDDSYGETEKKTSVDQLHLNMDAWPLGKLKIAAVSDLIQDKNVRNEFLFDFIVYHSRWEELTGNDYKALSGKQDRTGLFGAEMRKEVELAPYDTPDPAPEQMLPEHTVGQEYLLKIIDECQRRGIGVVVSYLPFCATTEDKLAANSAGAIANAYGVPYVNMLNADIIDVYSDLNDTGHLNISGAAKVTEFWGQWFVVHGDLTDHRGDARYEAYENAVAEYMDENRDFLIENDDLYSDLEMLMLNDVSCVVYFNQDSNAFNDERLKNLVSQIADSQKVIRAKGPYILINDAATYTKYEANGTETLNGVSTGLGTMVYQPVELLFRLLYPMEDESMNYLYDDNHINYDIQLIAYDKEDGEVICHKYYRSYGDRYRID